MTRSDERGFSLVELLVVVALSTAIGALALVALASYGRGSEHQGTADEVVSAMRTTAQRALSEGRTYCLRFDTAGDAWTTWRSRCGGTGVQQGGAKDAQGQVEVVSPSFTPANAVTDPCPVTSACAYFYPRGTASPGTVVLRRDGRPDITVRIEGLTSRVSRS